MNESAATVFIEDLINKSNLSPEFKHHLKMVGSPAVLALLYKGNGEVVMRPPSLKLGDTISEADVKRMVREGVAY